MTNCFRPALATLLTYVRDSRLVAILTKSHSYKKWIAGIILDVRQYYLDSGDLVPLGLAVVEAARHLPPAQIELPLRAAAQTRSVRTAVTREGATHFGMPAPKDPRHQAPDSSRNT